MSSFDLRISRALCSLILSVRSFSMVAERLGRLMTKEHPLASEARSAPSADQPSRANPFAVASDLSMSQNLRDL